MPLLFAPRFRGGGVQGEKPMKITDLKKRQRGSRPISISARHPDIILPTPGKLGRGHSESISYDG